MAARSFAYALSAAVGFHMATAAPIVDQSTVTLPPAPLPTEIPSLTNVIAPFPSPNIPMASSQVQLSDSSTGTPSSAPSSMDPTSGSIQANSIHDMTLRIATGATSGGLIDPAIIPRGDIFTGFDIRPDTSGNMGGIKSSCAFNDDSITAAVDDFYSGITSTPVITPGVITNDQDLGSAMDIATQAGGTFIGGSAAFESSFQYNSKSASSSHQVVGYTMGTMKLPGRYLHNYTALTLCDDALDLLNKPDLTEFFDTYGSHFVRTRVYGCQSIASYSYTCKSQSASLDIASSLHANYNGGLLSIGGGVDSKFSQYAKSSMCSYNGMTQSTGVGSKSPTASSMLDAAAMETYWKDFGDMCTQGAQTDSQLLSIELGNWADLPAVWDLVKNDTYKRSQVLFYLNVYPQDLEAISTGMIYQQRINQAIANFPTSLANGQSTPFYTGFFDRVTGKAMAEQPPLSYWSNLKSSHAALAQAQAYQATWGHYGNTYQVNQAILNNQNFGSLARKYYNGMVSLFNEAAAVYKYSWNTVTATALSFDTDNVTPISAQVVVPVDTPYCSKVEPVTGWSNFCDSKSDFHAGSLPIQFGIRIDKSSGSDFNDLMVLFARLGGDGPIETYADNVQNPNADDFIDYSNYIQTRYCASCTDPVHIEVNFQYNMPDLTLNMNPYN